MKVVFASNNPGKTHELKALLKKFYLNIIPQNELGVNEAPETGLTFIENALIKARHASHITGLPAIADDSGLTVTALQDAPGIYSARYAGHLASAQDNIKKLLHELKNIPDEQRTASFHCILVYLEHEKDPMPLIGYGTWHGTILHEPRGNQGFGYDPVFFDQAQNCTAAELPLNIKNRISHRGKALRLLIEQLSEKMN